MRAIIRPSCGTDDDPISDSMLAYEDWALANDSELYKECFKYDGKFRPLRGRVTHQEKRDGAIIFWHVYWFIKERKNEDSHSSVQKI